MIDVNNSALSLSVYPSGRGGLVLQGWDKNDERIGYFHWNLTPEQLQRAARLVGRWLKVSEWTRLSHSNMGHKAHYF